MPSINKLKEYLKEIAVYSLPTFTFDDEKYVRFQAADYLRTVAKTALKSLEPLK